LLKVCYKGIYLVLGRRVGQGKIDTAWCQLSCASSTNTAICKVNSIRTYVLQFGQNNYPPDAPVTKASLPSILLSAISAWVVRTDESVMGRIKSNNDSHMLNKPA
jgi:hypothetical protein